MFGGPLKFGTAGLRARMGPGESQMNTSVIARATWGLGRWLLERDSKTVVVCFDARKQSEVFARVTAEVLSAQGLSAYLSARPLPTPVLAYAVTHLAADAGVMVTASHNPRDDNGYKVYLGDGCQIAPPVDVEIANLIEQAPGANQIPRNSTFIQSWPEEIWRGYVQSAAHFLRHASRGDSMTSDSQADWVYTPMHGVGAETLLKVITELSWPEPRLVSVQAKPDGAFPTLPFPNPEEEGALAEAIKVAQTSSADLIIANDPDADRCAVMVRRDEVWRQLNGDEVGAVLAKKIIEMSTTASRPEADQVLATTLVSSTLLSKMALANGFSTKTTLTGFKWIGRIQGLVYGYEEALGYCVDPSKVKDKDGITAALLVLQVHHEAKSRNKDLLDALDEIYTQYGLHFTDSKSIRFHNTNEVLEVVASIAYNPPTEVASLQVCDFVDLTRGWRDLPPTSGVLFHLGEEVRVRGEQVRVVIRPSGTEPKIKTYLEIIYPPNSTSLTREKSEANELANRVHSALKESVLCPR
jgi:phosphomannomutase